MKVAGINKRAILLAECLELKFLSEAGSRDFLYYFSYLILAPILTDSDFCFVQIH